MSGKILIVDDEPEIVSNLVDLINSKGFTATGAADGAIAIKRIEDEGPYDLVISDMRMPNKNGLDLLRWLLDKKLETKLIFITGFSDSSEVKAAYELGIKKFLNKPILNKDILEEINLALSSQTSQSANTTHTAEAADVSAGAFARVPIDEFISGKSISYPVYMRMNDGKYIKLAHTGEDLSPERILKVKEKGIKEFWLTADDFRQYHEMSKKILGAVVASKNFSSEKKLQMIRHACSVASENLRSTGINENSIKEAQSLMELTMTSTLTGKDVGDTLFGHIESQEQASFAHNAMCGMLAGLMVKIMDWSSKKNIMAVTTAAFLHDIGISKLPIELQTKPYSQMTAAEKSEYEKHPLYATEILKGSGVLTDEVIKAIEQHHEDVRGSGYPRRLSRSEISPLSRIVFLVDSFCDFLSIVPAAKRKQPLEVLSELQNRNRGAFDLSAVKALELALSAKSIEAGIKAFKTS